MVIQTLDDFFQSQLSLIKKKVENSIKGRSIFLEKKKPRYLITNQVRFFFLQNLQCDVRFHHTFFFLIVLRGTKSFTDTYRDSAIKCLTETITVRINKYTVPTQNLA